MGRPTKYAFSASLDSIFARDAEFPRRIEELEAPGADHGLNFLSREQNDALCVDTILPVATSPENGWWREACRHEAVLNGAIVHRLFPRAVLLAKHRLTRP